MYYFHKNGYQIDEYHRQKPPLDSTDFYFIWIRNPLDRLVSAFKHSKNITTFDPSNLDPENLSLDNCPAPSKIRRKIKTGYAWNEHYDSLINHFESANHLGEALSSTSVEERSKAQELIKRPEEHIAKGVHWHLSDRFINKNAKLIIHVGCVENFNHDLRALCEKIHIPYDSEKVEWRRKVGSSHEEKLSKKAILNLKKSFSEDYKTIRRLNSKNLIEKSTVTFLLK
jgi:hypothetical protein